MTDVPKFDGLVRFKVAGQTALPKWAQQAISNALDSADSPPESLRFQCRIATDARENFKEIELNNGETLSLHPRCKPQFGKNSKGEAYLTATLVYSGDGESYKFQWIGDAVPTKMKEVAVKHDKGLSVRAATVGLNLSAAKVTPSWKANGQRGPASERDYSKEVEKRKLGRGKLGGASGVPRRSRHCGRVLESDLSA